MLLQLLLLVLHRLPQLLGGKAEAEAGTEAEDKDVFIRQNDPNHCRCKQTACRLDRPGLGMYQPAALQGAMPHAAKVVVSYIGLGLIHLSPRRKVFTVPWDLLVGSLKLV